MLDASGDNNKESNIFNYLNDTADISINNQGGIPTQINKQSLIDDLSLFKENNNDSVHEMLEIKQGSALENLSDIVRELLAAYLQDKNIEKLQQRYSPMQFKADIERLNNISTGLLIQLQTNPTIEDLNKLIYTYRETADLKLGIIHFHNSGSLPVLGTNNMLPVTIRDARLQSYMNKNIVAKKPGDISEHWLEVICNRVRGATIFIEIHTNKHLVAIAKQNLMKIFASYNHKLLGNTESEFLNVVNQFNEDLFNLLIKYNHSNVTPLSKDDLKLVCDYSQLDEEHKHVINITSDVSNDQTPRYPIILSLVVAAISNNIREREYDPINQFSKSSDFNILRDKHFRMISSAEEQSLEQATQQCALWFRSIQQLEQELVIRYHDKIVSNKKLIPATLYNLPGLRNACLEIVGIAVTHNNKGLALNEPRITTGFLVPIDFKNSDEEARITKANLLQLKSLCSTDKLNICVLLPKTNILFMTKDSIHAKKLQKITKTYNSNIVLDINTKNKHDVALQDNTSDIISVYVCGDGASRSGITATKNLIRWATQNCCIDYYKIAFSIFIARHQEYKIGGPGVATGVYGIQFHEELSKTTMYIPSPIAYAGRIHFNPLLTKCSNFAKHITTLCSKFLLNMGKLCLKVLTKYNNESKKTSLPTKQDVQLQDIVPSRHASTLTAAKPLIKQFLPNKFLSNEINNKITSRNSINYIIADTTGNRKTTNLIKPKNNKAKTPHRHP